MFLFSSKAEKKRAGRKSRSYLPLGLEHLESRTLLSAAPIGSVDGLNRSQIYGWAYDPDDGAAPLNILVTINGSVTSVAANAARPDLAPAFGSAYHGFIYTMPTLSPGTSTVLVQAVSPSTGVLTTLRSATLTNPPPQGWLDVHSDTQIAGWAFDPDSTNPIQVRVDVNGVAGTPVTTNVSRPDVAGISGVAAAGFSIPGSYAGKVVEVYAIDAPSGQATLLWTNNTLPVGSVDVSNGFTVQGWAIDPDSPSASINVQVDIDGVAIGSPTAASLSRTDLVPHYGSANHGFSITIPGLTPGTHTISVYALDGQAESAAPVLLSSKSFTNAPPVGSVDVVNSSVISGWALDPDLGATPTNVSIFVDDTLFTTVAANLSRPDLAKAFGSPNHGFRVDLSSLAPGSHSISVTASDNRVSDESEVVIFDDFINNHQPIGSLDSVSNNTASGWAQDPDTATSPVQVDIYVDGVYSKTTTANLSRPDLTPGIGSPNHGFSVALPQMTFGTHHIEAFASESQGNVSTLVGQMTVVNNRPIGSLDLVNTTTVQGWAADFDTPTTSLIIQVYVNGVQVRTGTANQTRNDLAAYLGSANHGFSITLPTLSSGRNQIDVYAVDQNSGLISALGTSVIMV